MDICFPTFQAVLALRSRGKGSCSSTGPGESALLEALEKAGIHSAEWDPDRGLYWLGFQEALVPQPTLDVSQLQFSGPGFTDVYRFEWSGAGRLLGVELQTHAPGPLPLATEMAPFLPGDQRRRAEGALSLEAWKTYLTSLE